MYFLHQQFLFWFYVPQERFHIAAKSDSCRRKQRYTVCESLGAGKWHMVYVYTENTYNPTQTVFSGIQVCSKDI